MTAGMMRSIPRTTPNPASGLRRYETICGPRGSYGREPLVPIRSLMRASLRAFAVIVAVVAPVSAQPSPDANRLMQEIIDSLAVTADAHGAIVNAGAGDIEHMTGTRLAIGKLNQAAQLMEPFAKSPDGMSSDVASAFSLVYQSLAELLTQSLDTFEKVVRIEGRVRDGGTASYAV